MFVCLETCVTTIATTDRRARNVAAFGFILQLASFGALLGISLWSGSDAVASVARLVLVGIPVWALLLLIFTQMRRVSAEELETTELKRAQKAGVSNAIFDVEDEQLLVERSRLQWMVKWLLPGVTILLSVYLLVGQFIGWGWTLEAAFQKGEISRTQDPTLMVWFVVGVGFLCFLYARYVIALSRIPEWRPLHAGATFMAGNALACLALAVALMAGTTLDWVEPFVAVLIRVTLVVLGLELAANFVLDLYRPRVPGEMVRPSFDSRLLGLISAPGGIARSIAEAVNYQFGFDVSSTWFYQLLRRWLLPIMVTTLVVVFAMSSIVVVDADEQAVVERLGRIVDEPTDVLLPGLHFKWPYPFDLVYRAPVKRIRELVIGEAPGEKEDHHPGEAIVWTEAHDHVPELLILVASPQLAKLSGKEVATGPSGGTESVAVSLLMMRVPIKYRIKDIEKYLYGYDDPVKLMEGVAHQYLSDYAASVDIDELMGRGREDFNARLKKLIQDRLDELDVGIEIVFAGICEAHPTAKEKVAEAFQGVISAEINKDATIHAARGEAQRILTSVAGTQTRAERLDRAILERDRLATETGTDPQTLAKAERNVDDLLMGNMKRGVTPMTGEAAAVIAAAEARASEWISRESAKARTFSTEVSAFSAAPELYRHRKILEVYEGLGHIRKYLIEGDASNVIIEYDTAAEGGLDQVLTEGLEKERARKGNP